MPTGVTSKFEMPTFKAELRYANGEADFVDLPRFTPDGNPRAVLKDKTLFVHSDNCLYVEMKAVVILDK